MLPISKIGKLVGNMNYKTITYNFHKIYEVKVDLDIESILPKKGYVYSFPSNLSHRPNEAPNSTNQRIVGVANIKFIYQ